MRALDDIAIRARNWFWYWLVKSISGLSDDQLDRRCFGHDCGRKRYFERIRRSGSSPNAIAIVDGHTLLEIVDRWDAAIGKPGPYAPATMAFQSKLWSFLSTPNLDPGIYSTFIQNYVCSQGWVRVCGSNFPVFLAFYGPDEPALQRGVSTAYSAMLHRLVLEATPDALAVLIALFREAMHEGFLDQAIAVREAIRSGFTWMFSRSECVPDDVVALLWRLVEDRVLLATWLTQADWRLHAATQRSGHISTRERIRELHAWRAWYVNESRSVERPGFGMLPIAPGGSRINGSACDLHVLRTAYEHLAQARLEAWIGHLFRFSDPHGERSIADREAAEGLRILEALGHPSTAAPVKFYDGSPPIEMANLPEPY